ncbi:hypothetical protein MAMC_01663 [Methylacidimicrobium cyclopophantes]|uniref:Uncharacterized protein n=1 Tax=Methylacidimicrobium cyclopophantes TaxID=1041766 RepID=A0A5E6MEV6_9BACT|nr:hypothetical protein [Methylacidimicrobium cyclopophantes]VVM07506.1 hypothetical protein MAMC_01663 [Methylacidimicrobium cyclopophantes]
MNPLNRLQGISKMWGGRKPTDILVDPEDPLAKPSDAGATRSKGGLVVGGDGDHANGAGSTSESLILYRGGNGGSLPIAPQGGRERNRLLLVSLGVAILLAGGLAFGGYSYWSRLQVPGSIADDEYHAFDRTVAQYEKWRNEILDWINGRSSGADGPRKKFGLIEAKTHLPPEEAVHACLRRHLPGYVVIDSIEPLGYRKVGGFEELEYRVTVESPMDLYIVPAFSPSPDPGAPELVKEVWPDLLFDATLPPGMGFQAGEKERYLLAKADQKLSFSWKVEKAQIVDGKWRILRVSPPLLEWNNGFLAAALDGALRGRGNFLALFLCQGKDLGEYSASYDRCVRELQARYGGMEADIAQAKKELENEVTKAPKGIDRGIDTAAVERAGAEGFSEGMDRGQQYSDILSNFEGTTGTGVIPDIEPVLPFLHGIFGREKAKKEEIARQQRAARARYYARRERHAREAREALQKGNEYQQQQEAKFVQYYRDLASKRVEDVRAFIQRTAMAEDRTSNGGGL